MCNPASFVLTKDRVFWSIKSDSHEDIIEEFRLIADGVRGPNILRVEIIPNNGDFSSEINNKNWIYKIDQDISPEWFDKENDKNRAFEALKEWQNKRVILNKTIKVEEGIYWAYGSSQVMARNSSQVTACDSSQVTAYYSSQVTAYDSSQVTACDSSQVTACDSSQVTARNSSQVTARNSSQVTAYGSSQVTAYGSSQVTAYGSSQVTAYNKQNPSILKSSLSVLIDRSNLCEVKVFVGTN